MLSAFCSQLSALEHGSGIKHSRRKAKTPRGIRVKWRVFRARWCELQLNILDSYEYYGLLTLMSEITHNMSEKCIHRENASGKAFPSGGPLGSRESFRVLSLNVELECRMHL